MIDTLIDEPARYWQIGKIDPLFLKIVHQNRIWELQKCEETLRNFGINLVNYIHRDPEFNALQIPVLTVAADENVLFISLRYEGVFEYMKSTLDEGYVNSSFFTCPAEDEIPFNMLHKLTTDYIRRMEANVGK